MKLLGRRFLVRVGVAVFVSSFLGAFLGAVVALGFMGP